MTEYDGRSYRPCNAGGNAIMALCADVRRVVTTIDSKDKAVVLLDGANPHKKVRPQTQTGSPLPLVTGQTAADLSRAFGPGRRRIRCDARARAHRHEMSR